MKRLWKHFHAGLVLVPLLIAGAVYASSAEEEDKKECKATDCICNGTKITNCNSAGQIQIPSPTPSATATPAPSSTNGT